MKILTFNEYRITNAIHLSNKIELFDDLEEDLPILIRYYYNYLLVCGVDIVNKLNYNNSDYIDYLNNLVNDFNNIQKNNVLLEYGL